MKVTELNGLYVGHWIDEDFRVLIAASDEDEAADVALDYGHDAGLTGSLEIEDFSYLEMEFDCDSVISRVL